MKQPTHEQLEQFQAGLGIATAIAFVCVWFWTIWVWVICGLLACCVLFGFDLGNRQEVPDGYVQRLGLVAAGLIVVTTIAVWRTF